jgi:hypothetical protein
MRYNIGGFGLWTITLLCCKFGQIGSVTTCARERGRDWERNEGADSPVVLDFEREHPLVPAGSGEGFRRSGGVFQRGRRGELARRGRGLNSRGAETKEAEIRAY